MTEMRKRGDAIPGLLLVGGLALLLLRRAEQPPGGGSPDLPELSNVNGAIRNVSVLQTVEKTPAETLRVNVEIIGSTTNSLGNPIAWPYRIELRIGHSTFWGWKEAGALGIPSFRDFAGNDVAFPLVTPENGVSISGPAAIQSQVFRPPDDPDQMWDVHVWLQAKKSDAAGNPTNEWVRITSEFKADGILRTVPTIAPAAASGSISSVSVSQRRKKLRF